MESGAGGWLWMGTERKTRAYLLVRLQSWVSSALEVKVKVNASSFQYCEGKRVFGPLHLVLVKVLHGRVATKSPAVEARTMGLSHHFPVNL